VLRWARGVLFAICSGVVITVLSSGTPASATGPEQDPNCTRVIYAPGNRGNPDDPSTYTPVPGSPPGGPEGPGAWVGAPRPVPLPPSSAPSLPHLAVMGPPPSALDGVPGVEVRDVDENGHSYYRCVIP
jgi:hypothetical protein